MHTQSCPDYNACQMWFDGHEKRLISLEETSKEILPALGKVVQAVENFSEHFNEMKSDLKAIKSDIGDFKLTNANYAMRLSILEQDRNKTASIALERRMSLGKTVLGICGAVLTAALIYWLGFRQ
jgi:chromosome segregation ATPase